MKCLKYRIGAMARTRLSRTDIRPSMKCLKYRIGAMALAVMALLLFNPDALAGQYTAKEIGHAAPMWAEVLGAVNSDGDAAWTNWNGSSGTPITHGQLYHAGNAASSVLGASAGASWAIGLTDRVDGNIWVVGSTAQSQRRVDQSATLWKMDANTGQIASSKDIGGVTLKHQGQGPGTVQQSALYDVSLGLNGTNVLLMGGFARDRVANSVFPEPAIWALNITTDDLDYAVLPVPNAGSGGYGYVTGIAANPDTHKTWACGNGSGTAGVYVHAMCWDISPGIDQGTLSAQMNTDIQSAAGFGQLPVTSVINRVKSLPVGAGGSLHTVVVGMAMVGNTQDSASYQWRGFVYDLDDGSIWTDFALTAGNDIETLVYDAAGVQYAQEGTVNAYGMEIGGVSRTTGSHANNVLAPGPMNVNTAALRGTSRRMLTAGISDAGTVCSINDDSDSPNASNYDQLVALSANGDYRLAQDEGGRLYWLKRTWIGNQTVDINQRDVPAYRKSTRASAGTGQLQYYHAETTPPPGTATALVRLGALLDCQNVDYKTFAATPIIGALCTAATQASFDIENGQHIVLNAQSSTKIHSAKTQGVFDQGANVFAQVAYRDTTDHCSITPVQSIDVLQKNLNPEYDVEGDSPWGTCGGGDYIYHTLDDVDHCAKIADKDTTCTTVQPGTCYNAMCAAGQPALDSIDANHCAIGPNNGWVCHPDGPKGDTWKPYLQTSRSGIKCGGASQQSVENPCIRCDAAVSQTSWTTRKNTMCCDGSGIPQMDIYDRTVSNQSSHNSCSLSQMGIDKNSGYSGYAWWIDPRGLNGSGGYQDWKMYTQDSNWSNNGVCNLSSSTNEPQDLTKSSGGSPGYVRRIRATFTPGIDEHDWYGFQVDDDGNGATTPKPRVRVRSHGQVGAHKARLQVCMYVDCMAKGQGQVKIKDLRFRGRGRGKFYPSWGSNPGAPEWIPLSNLNTRTDNNTYGTGGNFLEDDAVDGGWLFDRNGDKKAWIHHFTVNPKKDIYYNAKPFRPDNTPAYDGRGGCFQTDDQGLVDLSMNDYDCTDTPKEEAWIYVSVNLAESNVDALTCQDLKYTMYYGNDRNSSSTGRSTIVMKNGWNYGCDDCCDEGSW